MAEQSRVDKIMEGVEQSRLDEVLSTLNKETLTPIVHKALKRADIELKTWCCVQVKGGISGNQVYKVSGQGAVENTSVAWSLFLKILNQSTDVTEIDSTDWKREPLAYQEGILDDLPGGLRAAECYQLDYLSDTEIWMWLEDVSEPEGALWSLERYGLLAYHLGQLNGAYLTDRAAPSHGWLLRNYERQAIPRDCNRDAFNLSLNYLQDNDFLSADSALSITRLWNEKEGVLTTLYDRLPQTFSHFDSDRRNVFSRTNADGIEESVAIDWGLVGTGPVGGELKHVIIFHLLSREVEVDRAKELYNMSLDGYLNGLKNTGWKGNSDLIRYGCALTTGLFLLRLWSLLGTVIPDEGQRARLEQNWGYPFDEKLALNSQVTSFTLELVDEVRDFGQSL